MAKEILVVEDERALAASLVRAIEKMGYACRVVYDGNAALEAVAEATPDAILLDLLLPKKDGHAVMEKLQASNATSGIAIIAMSGVYRGRDQAAVIEKAGGKAFLAKPFSSGDLQALLHRHAGRPDPQVADDEGIERLPLDRNPVASVLWEAMAREFSGALHFQNGKKQKVVVLQEGRPVAVRSNLAREALGRRLLDSGRLDERTYRESLRRNKSTGQPQGEILVAMGALGRPELEGALAEQAEEKLLALFAWTEGEAWHKPGVRSVSLSSELREWTPQRLILRGVLRTPPEALLTALAPSRDARVERGPVHLDPALADPDTDALLAALGGPESTVAHLADMNLPGLYGLWLCGVVRFKDGSATERAAAPTPPPAEIQLERELSRRLSELAEQDHFEALGVTQKASAVEVRKAFFSLAKSVHPDKLATGSASLRDQAGQIFARLSQAHETLADPEARKRYLAELKRGTPTRAAPGAVQRIMSAESHFKECEEAVRRKDWSAALHAIESALELEPDEGEYHALRGWAQFMTEPEEPSVRAAAAEALKKATTLAPKSPTGYYYLGQMQKSCGDTVWAERMFRKVLELRPGHVEATSELRLIGLRRAKGDSTAAGKRFGFGRKK